MDDEEVATHGKMRRGDCGRGARRRVRATSAVLHCARVTKRSGRRLRASILRVRSSRPRAPGPGCTTRRCTAATVLFGGGPVLPADPAAPSRADKETIARRVEASTAAERQGSAFLAFVPACGRSARNGGEQHAWLANGPHRRRRRRPPDRSAKRLRTHLPRLFHRARSRRPARGALGADALATAARAHRRSIAG